jgi:pantothenate kinase
VCARVNAATNAPTACVSVPMDGYHLTRAQLAAMHDPAYAASRRGAYWTFDEAGFVAMVQKLRLEGQVSVPSFDHGTGDPVPDAIQVEPTTAVVILGARVRGAAKGEPPRELCVLCSSLSTLN